jgi:hypothetical protein
MKRTKQGSKKASRQATAPATGDSLANDTEVKLRQLVAQHGLPWVFEKFGPTARRVWRCCQLYAIANRAIANKQRACCLPSHTRSHCPIRQTRE